MRWVWLARWVLRPLFRVRLTGNSQALHAGDCLVVAGRDALPAARTARTGRSPRRDAPDRAPSPDANDGPASPDAGGSPASSIAAGRPALPDAARPSLLGALLLAVFLPGRPVLVVERAALAGPWARLLLSLVPHVVLDPSRPWAVRDSLKLITAGWSLLVFPGREPTEYPPSAAGTNCPTATGAPARNDAGAAREHDTAEYDTAALIAAWTGAPVVPVRVDGLTRACFGHPGRTDAPRRRRPRVTIALQPAVRIGDPASRVGAARLAAGDAPDPALPVGSSPAAHALFEHAPAENLPPWSPPFPASNLNPDSPGQAPNAAAARLSARERRRHVAGQLRDRMRLARFAARPSGTLYAALLDAVAAHGCSQNMAGDLRKAEYDYGELLRMTHALGRLGAKVSEDGEAVGVLLPNLASTVCLTLGLSAMRRVPAMLNYTAGAEALQSACTAARIRTVITSREFLATAKLGDTVAALRGVSVHCLEDLRARFHALDKLWLVGWARFLPRRVERRPDPEAAAVILFTSGSEGSPKGVVLSHRALLANIAQVRAVLDIRLEDRLLTVLPSFHSFGLTIGALLPVLSGARLFLYPSPLHYKAIPEIARTRGCTVLLGTGTFLAQYARAAAPGDFKMMRYVVAGAEKLAEPVRALWQEKFGIRLLEGYGATETAPVLAVNIPDADRLGSVGRLLPGIEAHLRPVAGVARGGLLQVRGPGGPPQSRAVGEGGLRRGFSRVP